MFKMLRRRRGSSASSMIAKLVVLGVALHYTGAGEWLAARVSASKPQCQAVLAQVNEAMAESVCHGLGDFIVAMDRGGEKVLSMVQSLSGKMGGAKGDFSVEDIAAFQTQFLDYFSNGRAQGLLGLMSSSENLASQMAEPPSGIAANAGSGDRLRQLLDSFVIGQKFLQGGSAEDATKALSWLQQGAGDSGYGVLSQLSLGDVYRQGSGGVAADPAQASHYYGQAAHSIDVLQALHTPESAKLLQGLPMEPEQLKKQLLHAMQQLQGKK